MGEKSKELISVLIIEATGGRELRPLRLKFEARSRRHRMVCASVSKARIRSTSLSQLGTLLRVVK
jgi:hypothetical protein